MSIRIRALEDKISRLQVKVKKKKGRISMEDTSEEEDELIKWVGSKFDRGHDQSKICRMKQSCSKEVFPLTSNEALQIMPHRREDEQPSCNPTTLHESIGNSSSVSSGNA